MLGDVGVVVTQTEGAAGICWLEATWATKRRTVLGTV